jgi:hypothetical protein
VLWKSLNDTEKQTYKVKEKLDKARFHIEKGAWLVQQRRVKSIKLWSLEILLDLVRHGGPDGWANEPVKAWVQDGLFRNETNANKHRGSRLLAKWVDLGDVASAT